MVCIFGGVAFVGLAERRRASPLARAVAQAIRKSRRTMACEGVTGARGTDPCLYLF
jgi:hypothetical protein